MSLVLNQRNVGPVTLLELSERLTIENVPEFRDTVHDLAVHGHRSLLLDCSRITVVDSMGIGSLLSNWVSLRRQGGKMELLNPSVRLRELLQMVGMHKVIECFDDVGQALRAF